ncbi:Glycogen [starch] synthase [Acropora cervicornis]|uniref:Glycogen [starch] synthase n=1 Tax=Acropora cervicornis TaxID=6130 RepID=A0AAD9QX93_ACRCE|nr:Glycogen [starch] synthase [Acropora cervicornis]
MLSQGNSAKGWSQIHDLRMCKETVNDIQDKIGKRIYESCLGGKLPDSSKLLEADDIIKLKRCILGAKRPNLPAIVTHNMMDDSVDPILCNLRRTQLFNKPEDRVKSVTSECNLKTSAALTMNIIPSNETECTVMGIPSVTTNLSGFGRFMAEHVTDPTSYGIYLVDRRFKSAEESINELTQYMFSFCSLTRRQRIIQRNRTERLSELLDWKSLHLKSGFIYSRPVSEPPSPAPSECGSEDEDEEDTHHRLFSD